MTAAAPSARAAALAAVLASTLACSPLGAQDSTEAPAYRTNLLRLLVTRAAARAATPARSRAWLEQDAAAFSVRDDGRAIPMALYQRQGRLDWDADAGSAEHPAATRGETYDFDPLVTEALRPGWFVPSAAGDRFRLRQPIRRPPTLGDRLVRATLGRFATQPETLAVVHPLARDRERAYRFDGGDTVSLALDGEAITAVRLRVRPRLRPLVGGAVFTGDVWLDARTLLLRRMRGRVDQRRTDVERARATILGDAEPIAYVDLRTEVRAGAAVPAELRIEIVQPFGLENTIGILRLTARLSYDSVAAPRPAPSAATTPSAVAPPEYRLIEDDGGDPRPWSLALGDAMRAAEAADDRFAPWRPPRARPDGPPITRFEVRRESELYRFNRVEGLFTGLGVATRLRDAMPGTVLRASGGVAWRERTWRARASLNRTVGGTTGYLGVGRLLDITNDFGAPTDSGSIWLPLLVSLDNFDYVERRYARVGAVMDLPGVAGRAILEGALVRDVPVTQHQGRGLFGGPFLPNRGADPVSYGRAIAQVEVERGAELDPSGRRLGGALRAELAEGGANYQRLEAKVVARARGWRGLALGAVLHGGVLLGTPIPQQLFELGAQQHLPGYAYKEFAGDRAASLDMLAIVPLGLLREPLGEVAGFVIPAIHPELQLGATAGWTDLTTPAAEAAARRLGFVYDPVAGTPLRDAVTRALRSPGATRTVRATISIGVRLFGGAVFAGAGRAVDGASDAPREWRAVFGVGRVL